MWPLTHIPTVPLLPPKANVDRMLGRMIPSSIHLYVAFESLLSIFGTACTFFWDKILCNWIRSDRYILSLYPSVISDRYIRPLYEAVCPNVAFRRFTRRLHPTFTFHGHIQPFFMSDRFIGPLYLTVLFNHCIRPICQTGISGRSLRPLHPTVTFPPLHPIVTSDGCIRC